MISEIECVISGRVQMVMFRDFAKRTADKLGLTGFVENLSDGTVHLVAQGEREMLTRYIDQYLKSGPTFAKVASVRVEWKTPVESYPDFRIRFSGFFDRL
ncbi:MAG: acylphosphatase [Patescibacteria group bacterium]